jgi:predicted DCC family thiol-disulfide oxidoreductase YuxK
MPELRPTLIFDGECGICRTWVDYWYQLTGNRICYRPYQGAARDFPEIPIEELRRAMVLVEPDAQAGARVYKGAAANFRLLSYAPGRGFWWWLYRYLPGFALLSGAGYTFLSRRRGLLAALTHFFWGSKLQPESYALASWLFLRGLGLVYIAAFASLAVQILGLVGSGGIIPLARFLPAAHTALGADAYWQMPTLFWLDASDRTLVWGAWAGVALGAMVTLGLLVRPALVALFFLYLSYVYAGQIFMNFQWDLLLLESGFLAIFLTGGTRIVVWLYRLLLFRFLFLAGVVKLASADPTWRSLTALDYHFWTQPLPTPLAWYAAQLPHWLLAALTGMTLVIELAVAFMILLPRRPRAVAGVLALAFQLGILLTGNYNFFNLLTMLLCLFLFDDRQLGRLVPGRLAVAIRGRAPRPRRSEAGLATLVALIAVPLGISLIWQPFGGRPLPLARWLAEKVSPLLIVNPYGVFAVMTTSRPEIVIEGSDDGAEWREYVLPFKEGPVGRPLRWNIPHQPRLDWQLWFAAFEGAVQNRWFEGLLYQLLRGSPDVLAFFVQNPFPQKPPKFVRAKLYDYRFADVQLRKETGAVWVRREEGIYFPQVSLSDFLQVSPGQSAGQSGGESGGQGGGQAGDEPAAVHDPGANTRPVR